MSKELFIPMSSLQCAYMIERERGLKTTGTPCHVYMEFDTVSINESLIDADIKKAGHQVDNDTLQQVIEYLIFNNGGNITVQALCSLTGKFAEVGAEFQRLHSMSATERMNDLYTTIERPNGQLMEHQRKMLNVLFRVFAQNFRCVSSYIPKVYTGKMRVFDCESAIANFFPSLFSEDKKTWEQYAQGEFLFDTMKGDHISCMNSPYIEENVKKILDL